MWKFNKKVKDRLKLDEFTAKRIEKIMNGHSDNRPMIWCDYCRTLNHATKKHCKGCGIRHWYGNK